MKVLFAPDTSDHPNWGCRMMGSWFRQSLARNGTPAVWRIPSAWFYQTHPELPNPVSMASLRHYARQVKEGHILQDLAAVLRACDLVYLNGENFIRPSTRKGRMLLFLAYIAKTVFHKPCVLTNHSLDLGEPELAEIAMEVFPLLDEVHFREETSMERYSGLVVPGQCRLIPDVAWAMPAAPLSAWAHLGGRDGHFCAWPDTAERFNPFQPYVTVCASSAYGLSEPPGGPVVQAYIELCRQLQKAFGQVVLAAPCEPDLNIMRQVQAALSLPLLGIHLPVRQAVDVFGNALVHVGGRWHPGIFASTGGTPLVAFSANSHKVHSLIRQLRVEGPVFDALDLPAHVEEIVALAEAQVAQGPDLRRQIMARAQELGSEVDGNLDYVRRLASRDHVPCPVDRT